MALSILRATLKKIANKLALVSFYHKDSLKQLIGCCKWFQQLAVMNL